MQVDFNAATEYDAVNNYKVLQAAFTKMGINKVLHLPLTMSPSPNHHTYSSSSGTSASTLQVRISPACSWQPIVVQRHRST